MNRLFVSLLFVVVASCETCEEQQLRGEFEHRAARITHLERELSAEKAGNERLRAELERHGIAVPAAPATPFSTWQTLKLGTDQPTDPARGLEGLGFGVSDYARELLAKTPFASVETSVDLVRATVAELGFPQGATTQEIFDHAAKLGLQRLPAETGYRLCLAHSDQPLGEQIRIGMDPIMDSDGLLDVFNVDLGVNGRWLDTRYARPTSQWGAEDVWVFGRSKH